MTATDELRRMLDERGADYGHYDGAVYWKGSKHGHAARDSDEGDKLIITSYHFTPEQAIEATLGRGTCKVDTEESLFLNIQRWHICGCCGTGFSLWYYTEDGDECEETPHYCPNCGRRVVAGDGA